MPRRLIAVLCLTALLIAALAPVSSSPLTAALFALPLFWLALIVVEIRRLPESTTALSSQYLARITARAPPLG